MRIFLVLAAALLAACGSPDTSFNVNPDNDNVIDNSGELAFTIVGQESLYAIDYLDIELNVPEAATLVIENTGNVDANLNWGRVINDAEGAFYTDERANSNRIIRPQQFFEVLVMFSPQQEMEAIGEFRVSTNDSEMPLWTVALHGTSSGWQGDTDTDTD